MAAPAVTRQNPPPATELTLNLSLTFFPHFPPTLKHTCSNKLFFPLHDHTVSLLFPTLSRKLIYSLFQLFMPMHAHSTQHAHTNSYTLTVIHLL